MTQLVQDLRYAVRTLIRSRMVSALAIVAFALGIGVTTAVFSIFNGVLLKPLPYPNPDELVMVFDTQPACATCPASFEKYRDWTDRNQVFAVLGGSSTTWKVLTGDGEPERVIAVRATATLNDVFRVTPELGRWFTPDEDRDGAGKVAVLAHDYWMRKFNGDRAVIGRRLILDGAAYDVIGVMPATFQHRNAMLFVPLAQKFDAAKRSSHFLATYARLKPGVTVDRATTEMRALGTTLAKEFGHNHGIDVRSFYEVGVADVRTSLQVLLGAVFLVLVIACANVANLLLAAGLARRRELAIRIALGAGQRHLARQLTAEGVVLALVGGAIGVVLAHWTVRAFVALAGNQLPRATTIALDGPVLAFAALVSLAVGVFCGVWPLVTLRARELTSAIREGDTRTISGAGRRFGNSLVVAEIALAFALLVGAGLLIKNLLALQSRDAGFRAEHVVAFDLTLATPRYTSDEPVRALYRELQQRFAAIGGVEKVGFISHLPMLRFGNNGEMSIEGGNPWNANQAPLVEYRWIYGDYFQTMGVPLLKGRLLDARDGPSTKTVVINKAMADKFWGDRDPIGRRFGQGGNPKDWWEVVGVVGNVRTFGLAGNSAFEFYRTIDQNRNNALTAVIRSSAEDPTTLIPAVRQIVRSIDPSLPVTGVQTMADVVAASVGRPRLMSALTGLFATLAGLLAMVGVYGVMAYNVRRQRREFGIRLALGAGAGDVRRLVVARGLVLALAGVAIGAAGAWLMTGVLRAMLNDVKPTDPWVFAGTALAVLVVALAASYMPARVAGKVDPMIVLRDA